MPPATSNAPVPDSPAGSSRPPTRTQAPRLTDRASGIVSVTTRRPEGSVDRRTPAVTSTVSTPASAESSSGGSAPSGGRKQRNRALAHFDASDLAAFWLLYTVNTHLPVVRHIFEGRRAHPEALYEALLGLGSALTSFSGELHPRRLERRRRVGRGLAEQLA